MALYIVRNAQSFLVMTAGHTNSLAREIRMSEVCLFECMLVFFCVTQGNLPVHILCSLLAGMTVVLEAKTFLHMCLESPSSERMGLVSICCVMILHMESICSVILLWLLDIVVYLPGIEFSAFRWTLSGRVSSCSVFPKVQPDHHSLSAKCGFSDVKAFPSSSPPPPLPSFSTRSWIFATDLGLLEHHGNRAIVVSFLSIPLWCMLRLDYLCDIIARQEFLISHCNPQYA